MFCIGFYQLTKPETIQAYKEIVAVRVSDGAQVSGDAVRDLLKIPSDAVKFKYTQVPDFEVFVQSTSYNRVLMPDTKFLYEVNPDVRGEQGSFTKLIDANFYLVWFNSLSHIYMYIHNIVK